MRKNSNITFVWKIFLVTASVCKKQLFFMFEIKYTLLTLDF